MSSLNDDLSSLGSVGDALQAMISNLRSGGPPVNFELVVHFIDGRLDEVTNLQVGQNIVTWRSWYDMYWETIAALDGRLPDETRLIHNTAHGMDRLTQFHAFDDRIIANREDTLEAGAKDKPRND